MFLVPGGTRGLAMAPATMDDQRPDRPTHFPFQVSPMASITLTDNVLNAPETATVTFTFDADYALAPANITAIGGPLSPPLPLPLHLGGPLSAGASESRPMGLPGAPPLRPPRGPAPLVASHIHPRHSGHT